MKLASKRVLKWYSATLGMSAGAVIYAYQGFAPVILGVLIFTAVSYCSLTAVFNTEEKFSPYQKISETLAAVGMVAFLPSILLFDFIVALVLFLGFAQLALNLQTHDYRRFYVGMVVSFVGICVGATEAKSGFYLVFFLIYTVLASLTLGHAYVAQRQDNRTPQWDWTAKIRVTLLVISMAVGIYLVLPRFPAGGLLSQPGSEHFYQDKKWEAEAKENDNLNPSDQIDDLRKNWDPGQNSESPEESSQTPPDDDSDNGDQIQPKDFDYKGFQDTFNINNPDEMGHRFSNRIVARMRADQPQYLRARIFDTFDGLHWRMSSDQTIKLGVGFNGVDLVAPDQYTSADLQSYEIYIEQNLGHPIPAAAVAVQLKFPATVIAVDIFGQLRSPGALKEGTAYAVTSQYNRLHGRLFAELDHPPMPSYLQLPSSMDPRIEELAGEVIQGAPSQLAAAIALEQHLRNHYEYDLGAAFYSQNNTLSHFLFESGSGHCEYFASALAVMLRTQGIPSRLVTGFSATNRNPLTGYYDIYALDGHAWVEAFVDGQGWVILEPTAYYEGPLPEEQTLSVQQINAYVQKQVKLKNALGLDELTLESLLNASWQLLYVFFSAGMAYVKLFIITHWLWLTLALTVVIGGRFAWRRYRYPWLAYCIHRKVAVYPADEPQTAIPFYLAAIEELLGLAGFENPPGYTIERYLKAVESVSGVQNDPALAAAFNRIFYNNEAGEQEVMLNYKQLFQRLYKIGLRDLRSMAKSGHPSLMNS